VVQVRVIVSGRVQGVWFRQSAADAARSLGLAGWVRNLRTGQVEAAFEGEEEAVERMIEWCRRGPPLADVTGLDVTRLPPEGLSSSFDVRPTA
jgi:acylphosphatase